MRQFYIPSSAETGNPQSTVNVSPYFFLNTALRLRVQFPA